MSESTTPSWPAGDPDLSTREHTPVQQAIQPYWSRAALGLGGLLTIISTFVGWLSFPIVGSFSLWKLSDIVNGFAGAVDSLGQSSGVQGIPGYQSGMTGLHQARLGLLLLPWGVLLLGVPALVLSVLLADGHRVRRAAGVFGAVISAAGLLGVVLIAATTSGTALVGIGGPIVLLVAGVVTLSGLVFGNRGPARVPVPAVGNRDNEKLVNQAAQGLYGVGGIGVVLLIVGLALLLTAGMSSPSASSFTNAGDSAQVPRQNNGWPSVPSPDWRDRVAPPMRSVPANPLTPPSTAQQPSPSEESGPAYVVAQYFDAINSGDYDTAWALGGSSISGMTRDEFANSFGTTAWDEWQPESLPSYSNTVHGTLRAVQTDGTTKIFKGSYTTDGNGAIVSADMRQVR